MSEPVNSQLWHQKRFRKPYILVDCWLLIDYGKGIIIVFSCVPNSKPTKLYWPFPTLWAHRRYYSKINESQIKIKIHEMWEWDMKVCWGHWNTNRMLYELCIAMHGIIKEQIWSIQNEKLFRYKELFSGTLILMITLGYLKPLNLNCTYKFLSKNEGSILYWVSKK